jgi:hypothetical protein
MAVAYDAVGSQPTQTTSPTWTHTPVGTPRGILVFVLQYATGSDDVTGVTYGGVAMTELGTSPLLHSTGETFSVYAYFLGTSIPTGAQSVAVTGTASNKCGVSYSVTANTDTKVENSSAFINSDSQANPSATLGLNGKTCFVALGAMSGHNGVASTTPTAGWTSSFEDVSSGVTQVSLAYKYDTIGSSDVTVGWTQTAEDATSIAVAITELANARSRGFIF